MKENKNSEKTLSFIGGGELAEHIYDLFKVMKLNYRTILFFDDQNFVSKKMTRPFRTWSNTKYADNDFILALGYRQPMAKVGILKILRAKKRNLISLIHPTASVAPSAKIGPGCIVFPKTVIDSRVQLGDGCIIHNGSIISHDCTIEPACFFGPGAVICGNCSIKQGCFIGAGTVIQDRAHINPFTRIAMGSAVLR